MWHKNLPVFLQRLSLNPWFTLLFVKICLVIVLISVDWCSKAAQGLNVPRPWPALPAFMEISPAKRTEGVDGRSFCAAFGFRATKSQKTKNRLKPQDPPIRHWQIEEETLSKYFVQGPLRNAFSTCVNCNRTLKHRVAIRLKVSTHRLPSD